MRRGGTGSVGRAARVAAMVAAAALIVGCAGSRTAPDAGAQEPASASTSTSDGATTDVVFGDLANPCGPGEPSGSPDQAVTESSVTIGYGDDMGYQARPGQGHEASDAVEALMEWCNEQGGINGRRVEGIRYDAKLTDLNNVMTEACAQTFMLVGQYFAVPALGEETRIRCGLPTSPGLITGTDLGNSPLMVSAAPAPVDLITMTGAAIVAEAFPEAVARTGVMVPEFVSAVDATQRFVGAAEEAGWTMTDCSQSFPISGVADFRPYLQRLQDCEVGAVVTGAVGETLQNMLDAAQQIGFRPVWFTSPAVYTENFAAWNTSGNGDDLYFPTSFVPVDHTPPGSANATYVDLVTRSGGDVAYSGQVSTSAFLLWATAADRCGNELTRDCVMEEMTAIRSWTGGGLSAEVDPGGNRPSPCQQVSFLAGTAWTQWRPTEPGTFVCDESLVVRPEPLPDSALSLDLDSDRVARRFATD